MPRERIHTDHAPAAIGPYSQATRAGGMVFLSGQIALDPATGEIVGDDAAAQARQAFSNLRAVCEAAGGIGPAWKGEGMLVAAGSVELP